MSQNQNGISSRFSSQNSSQKLSYWIASLRRGVLLAPRRVLFGAPRVLLVAVVEEVVDHALPGYVLGPPQVGVGVVPALRLQGFTPEV